jgi:site-specific recombinase XerD
MEDSLVEAEVRDYLQWLLIEKGRSRATIDAYRRDLDQYRDWLSKQDSSLLAASPEELEEFLNSQRSSGKAPSSIARLAASIRGFYAFCVDEGTLTTDPSQRVEVGRRGKTLPKPVSEELMNQLLDSVSGNDPISLRDRALLELLYGTGARVSEVTGLCLGDIDFDEELLLVTGKGNKQRLLPIGRALTTCLKAYLADDGRDRLLRRQKTDALFLNQRGGALSRQGVDLIIQQRALLAGVERSGLSAHVFRHSCATHMLAHGADIRVVQELLGHASISTTQLYTAVSITSLKRDYLVAHPRAHDL